MSKRKMNLISTVADETSQYFKSKEKKKTIPKIVPSKCKANVKNPQNEVKKLIKTNTQLPDKDIEDLNFWQPKNWQEVLGLIKDMRSGNDAPVDTMGCDQCADNDAAAPTKRLHLLLSLMLSSQTKDQVTFAAMGRLKDVPGGLNLETLNGLSEDELGRIIYPVGFWRSKAKYIKGTCVILKDKYNGDIPGTVEDLCKLPGVGPKMAHLCMKSAWGVISGIGVDTHVHRISNRLGWVKKETKTPENTRIALEGWLPKELWSEVNHLLVGLGQTICKPVHPNCEDCLAKSLCPSANLSKKSPKKRKSKDK